MDHGYPPQDQSPLCGCLLQAVPPRHDTPRCEAEDCVAAQVAPVELVKPAEQPQHRPLPLQHVDKQARQAMDHQQQQQQQKGAQQRLQSLKQSVSQQLHRSRAAAQSASKALREAALPAPSPAPAHVRALSDPGLQRPLQQHAVTKVVWHGCAPSCFTAYMNAAACHLYPPLRMGINAAGQAGLIYQPFLTVPAPNRPGMHQAAPGVQDHYEELRCLTAAFLAAPAFTVGSTCVSPPRLLLALVERATASIISSSCMAGKVR